MFRRITAIASLASLLFVSLAPVATFAATRRGDSHRPIQKKLAPEFERTANSTATVRVLMQTKGIPSAEHDSALQLAHGNKRATLNALDTIVADVPLNEIATLANRTDVEYISPD